jgi:vancomycin resistance protein YoaR
MMSGLRSLFPKQSDAVDASFVVRDGRPVLVPGHPGSRCCRRTAPQVILAALRRALPVVRLRPIRKAPDLSTTEARSLGIEAEIGRPALFGPTTSYACCEDRVVNIHRIADLVRGHVILPGETLSLNGLVGERTTEKGFVPAGVIYNGVFTTDVGGGVSQFATTLFNAALFAGLDFPEYQSHSIYIDRYPYGREATISYPSPDLKIRNSTPYGVLIWPTYTDTTLSVHLYSRPHAETRLGPAQATGEGACTRVVTPRFRTYPDGSVVEDAVAALYRPGEGADC